VGSRSTIQFSTRREKARIRILISPPLTRTFTLDVGTTASSREIHGYVAYTANWKNTQRRWLVLSLPMGVHLPWHLINLV
jgi:hypothetical protein